MKNIILAPNPYRDKHFQTVRSAVEVLKAAGLNPRVCLPFDIDRSYELPRDIRFHRLDREIENAEMVICFGGDGTILHMAKAATKRGIPILGVNIGTMGFMADLESSELHKLALLAEKKYTLDSRMMLDVTIQRDRDIIYHDICLNDVVITKGAVARIVHLQVKCDGVCALESGGDGVIISTPTGSTAYNFSAGGPIVDPAHRALIVTPICAHTLNARPILFRDDALLSVCCSSRDAGPVRIYSDGGEGYTLPDGATVKVTRSPFLLKLIRFESNSFYNILSKKIH